MITAEEILEQMRIEMPFALPERIRPYLKEAMQIYGRQCAEHALKDAAERSEASVIYHNEDQGEPSAEVDKESILQTPIVTP